jgi:hypothetical protein
MKERVKGAHILGGRLDASVHGAGIAQLVERLICNQ